MKDTEIAWLAGLLEGEGCFYFRGTSYIKLQMTDEDVIRRAADLMGRTYRRAEPRGSQKKVVFSFELCAGHAIEFMKLILPYMCSRRTAKINEIIAQSNARLGQAYGDRCGSSKLTDEQANEIKNRYIKGSRGGPSSSATLAKEFCVSEASIFYSVNKRRPRLSLIKR